MDESSSSSRPSALVTPTLTGCQDLPLSSFLLDYLKAEAVSKPMRLRAISIPLHSITPNTVTYDLNYERELHSIELQILAADRRSAFYGRAIHAVTANDSREAARLFTRRQLPIKEREIIARDQALREIREDRVIQNLDVRHSVIFKLQSLELSPMQVCPCPGCFEIYDDADKAIAHARRHTEKAQTYRCHFCASVAFESATEPSEALSDELDKAYFDNLNSFFIHIERHKLTFKGETEGHFLCPTCLMKFSTEEEAEEHCTIHADVNLDDIKKNLIY